jgi:hypothetical protein
MALDDDQLEHAVFMEIVTLHPIHPTLDELHLALSDSRGELGRAVVEDSLWSLRRFGLVRENGNVLEPTLAAIRATEVIQRI